MTKKHSKELFELAILVILIIVVLLVLSTTLGCAGALHPLCRHVVLSQYAAYKDSGYECEIWELSNKFPEQAGGYKRHRALRVRKDEGSVWRWVQQNEFYTTSTLQPKDTTRLFKLTFEQAVKLSIVPAE